MLSTKVQFDQGGHIACLELLGSPEPTQEFSIELFELAAAPYITRTEEIITLRDDFGAIYRYRITGRNDEGRTVVAELIVPEQ